MKINKILIVVNCVLVLAIVALSITVAVLVYKPDGVPAAVQRSIIPTINESSAISVGVKSQSISDIVINKPAIEQMSEKELSFYTSLLSNINLFNVPMSVRVVRINPIDGSDEQYLALLKCKNLLGNTLSGQFKISSNGIEESSENIHYSDPEFNIELINQAIEEYWDLDIYPEAMDSNEKTEIWGTDYYLDEFQKPTSDVYVTNKTIIWGQFSNSATTNDELAVKLVIDKDNVAIALYEYGSQMVKNYSTYSPISYKITMSVKDEPKQDITGTMYCGGDRVCIDDKFKSMVIDALCGGKTIDFYLQDDETVFSTYLFSIETDSFADVYTSTFMPEQPTQSEQTNIRGTITH